MRTIFRLFLAAAALLATTAATAVQPGSVEAYFRPSEFGQVSLSPDGRHIATRRIGDDYEMNLLVLDADTLVESNTPNARAITSFETGGVAAYMWKNDERLIFVGQADLLAEGPAGGNFVGAYSIGIDGSEPRRFLERYCYEAGNRGQFCRPSNSNRDAVFLDFSNILSRQADNDRYLTIQMGEGGSFSPYKDVYRLDTRTGRINQIEDSPIRFLRWYSDSEGDLRLAVMNEPGTIDYHVMYRDEADGEWRTILTYSNDEVDVQGFDSDDRHVVVRSRMGRDKFAVFRLDSATGDLGAPVIEDPDFDIETVRFTSSDQDQRPGIAYAATRGDIPRRYYVDAALQEVQDTVDYYFPDTQNTLESWDDAHNRFIIRAWNDRQPGRYYLLDMEAGKLRFLFDARPWQNPEEMGEMRPIEYTARDGVLIRGYITLPPGYQDGDPVPLILNPHGGPYGPRDDYGWSYEPQFFASRGWATLQVNYRGSGGYGAHFETMAYRQWGLEMQDDLTDAVAWAIDQGFADPDHVCIYGASYGGYATLQGLVKTPDLYACGVSYVAVSALDTLLDTDTRNRGSQMGNTFWSTIMQRYLGELGNDADMERLRATSPLYHVDRIRVPLLAIHGEADPRVDIDTQFYPLVRALRGQNKQFEQIVGPYEGHGFFTGEVTIDLYTRMAEFLSRYLD